MLYFDSKEIFRDFEIKIKPQDLSNKAERTVREPENNIGLEQNEPEMKGYFIHKFFELVQPLGPLNPFEPLIRRRRPLTPDRLSEFQKDTLRKTFEPLIDVSNNEKELPFEKLQIEI